METSVGSGETENFSDLFSYLAYGSGDVIAHQISRIDQKLDLVVCADDSVLLPAEF